MTILVTGSTGKTSKPLARLLQNANHCILIATRREPSEIPFPGVKFDWFDESTFNNPFESADIDAIYIVSPETPEPAPYVNPFIDLAVSKGVKKFVLLAGTPHVKGGPFCGRIWSHLEELAVQFAVLRPTWFMENFSELQHHPSIKRESVFYTAAEDGKIPFVSVNDIAEAAFTFLSGSKSYGNKDYIILGPESLSHDQVAATLSDVLGRKIQHKRKSVDDVVIHYTDIGLKPLFANAMPHLEASVRDGSEERLDDDLEELVGRKGIAFKDWAIREAAQGFWN